MKLPILDNPQRSTSARTLHDPVLPRLPERIRRLLKAPHAVYWGAAPTTLDEWRDAEQELKERIQNEHQERQ